MKILAVILCLLVSIKNCFAEDMSLDEFQFAQTVADMTIEELNFIEENKGKMPNIYKLFDLLNETMVPEFTKGAYEESGDTDLAYCLFQLKPSDIKDSVLTEYKSGKFQADDLFIVAEMLYSLEQCSDITQDPDYDRKNLIAFFTEELQQEMKKELMDTLTSEPKVVKRVISEEVYE